MRLVVGAIGAEGEAGHGDDRDLRVAKRGDPEGLDTNTEATQTDSFGIRTLDVRLRGVRAEQRVLDGPTKRGAQRGYFFRSL